MQGRVEAVDVPENIEELDSAVVNWVHGLDGAGEVGVGVSGVSNSSGIVVYPAASSHHQGSTDSSLSLDASAAMDEYPESLVELYRFKDACLSVPSKGCNSARGSWSGQWSE